MELIVLDDRTRSKPWYADGLAFTCTQCGNCCTGPPGHVWISREEIRRLARHLRISVEQTVQRYCRRVGGRYSLKEHRTPQGNYDCTFLEERKVERVEGDERIVHTMRICTIYPVRPLQCRTWPFWAENLKSEQSWNAAGSRCPGMDRGRHYSREAIEQLRDARDWPGNAPGSGAEAPDPA